MTWQNRTPAQAVFHWSQERPLAIAIASSGKEHNYLQVAKSVAAIALRLEKAGVRRGSVIGIQCNQRTLSLLLLLAIDALRATPAYLSTIDLSDQRWLDRCDVVLAEAPLAVNCIADVLIELTDAWLNSVLSCSVEDADFKRLSHILPHDDDHVFLGGTSSTTGDKKYFFDTRAALQHQLQLMAKLYFPDASINFICPYGVWLGAAYAGCFIALNVGSTIVFSSILQFSSDLNRYPGSHSALLLRDAEKIAELPILDESIQNRLSTVRVLGAYLSNNIRKLLEKKVSNRVINTYSSNEAGQVAEILSDGSGEIYPGIQVKIVTESRASLQIGEIGLIAINSPGSIRGYLWNDELTAKHFDNGWYYSSDLGFLTETGRIVIVGRADDMLNLGGVKISPTPYEQQIREIEGVSDCVLICENEVFGLDHLIVCVDLESGYEAKKLNELILSNLKRRFDHITTHFLAMFPRTDTGKVKRNELKEIIKTRMRL
ncbi:MAG: class I adenylate-forming enzyme family protein [Pseudomonadota bacterium]